MPGAFVVALRKQEWWSSRKKRIVFNEGLFPFLVFNTCSLSEKLCTDTVVLFTRVRKL